MRRLSTPAIVRSAAFAIFILHALRADRVEGSYTLVESVRDVGPIIAFLFCLSCGTITTILVYLDLPDGKRTDVGSATQTRKVLLVANIKNVSQEGPGGGKGEERGQAPVKGSSPPILDLVPG